MASEYDIMERAISSPLDRAVDDEIAKQNAAYVAGLCRKCSGTGRYYTEPTDGTNHWTRHDCERCGGSGKK